MRFAIYSRKSKFTGTGESIENQIDMCQNYISSHFPEQDYTIDVYEDEGFSGKNLNRPKFQEFLSIQDQQPYDYLVVYRLDRVSRNVGDFATLIDKLNLQKTSFICIKEQFDTSTPMGRAMMHIASVFAQLERETIAERIKDNMYMQAKNGKWTGGTTPLGYKSVKVQGTANPYYALQIDDEQVDLVKLIFKKYRELRSVNATEKFLFENDYKTQKGNEWSCGNLKRVLENPVYCIGDKDSLKYFTDLGCNVCFDISDCDGAKGILPYNRFVGTKREYSSPDKWIITVSQHKGLLSGEEWIEIQNMLKESSKNSFGGKNHSRVAVNPTALLSGILFCSCGAYMRPKKYPSGNMAYICEKKLDRGVSVCSQKNIPVKELDQTVLDLLFSYDVDNSVIGQQLKEMQGQIDSVDSELERQIKKLNKKKANNIAGMNNLMKALQKSAEDNLIQLIDLYNEQIKNLQKENTKIDERVRELSNTKNVQRKMVVDLNSIESSLEYLRSNFSNLSINEKRDFVKKIVEKVVWNGDSLDIFIKGVE